MRSSILLTAAPVIALMCFAEQAAAVDPTRKYQPPDCELPTKMQNTVACDQPYRQWDPPSGGDPEISKVYQCPVNGITLGVLKSGRGKKGMGKCTFEFLPWFQKRGWKRSHDDWLMRVIIEPCFRRLVIEDSPTLKGSKFSDLEYERQLEVLSETNLMVSVAHQTGVYERILEKFRPLARPPQYKPTWKERIALQKHYSLVEQACVDAWMQG